MLQQIYRWFCYIGGPTGTILLIQNMVLVQKVQLKSKCKDCELQKLDKKLNYQKNNLSKKKK